MRVVLLPKLRKRCVVIGTTRLCAFVLDELIKNRWNILCVVSNDLIIRDFCKKNKINCICTLDQVSVKDFVLFSVANYTIISEKFLKSNNVSLGINYHDSLLPKYSGVNSTTWAIYNNEQVHGVSWHLISPGIDQGDIIKQCTIRIDPNETAFSLNLKCSHEAGKLFIALLKDLETSKVKVAKQGGAKRTYFGRGYIPENYGILDFNDSFEKIDRLYRSLFFGTENYHNPISSLKIWDGEKFYLIESIEFKKEAGVTPGYIYFTTSTSICVGIKDGKLIIDKLKSYSGKRVLIRETKFNNKKSILPYIINQEERSELSQIRKSESRTLNIYKSEKWKCNSIFKSSFTLKKNKDYNLQIFHDKLDFDTIICKASFVLLNFINDELSVPVKANSKFKSKLLKEFIIQESYLYLHSKLQNLSYADFFILIIRFSMQSQLVPKDFFYRYRSCLINNDVEFLLYDSSLSSGSCRLTIVLNETSIQILGYQEDKALIDSFYTSLAYVINNKHIKLDDHLEDLFITPFHENQVLETHGNRNHSKHSYHFPSAFEKNVKNNPKTIAAVFKDEKIDYITLNERANQFAHYLQKVGVEPNTLIGVGLSRSLDLIVTLLGIVKAGCAYLPLDPTHPPERTQLILENSNSEVLITNTSLKRVFSGYKGQIIVLDEERNIIYGEKSNNIKIPNDPKRLAYVIYTSGSTGKPKGVEVEVGALNNLLHSIQKRINVSDVDNWLALTTISFDISNLEIFLPLCEGATVVLASEEEAGDPEQIKNLLDREGITVAQATPSTWQMLVDWGWNGKDDLTVLCGGEAMPKKLAMKLVTCTKNLWNMYGPTETTIWSSMKKITSSTKTITLGAPIDNTEFYILDANERMRPIGVPGELCIGGAGLARGYRNRRQLTKEKFIQTRFGKLYRTGDLVRYLADGEIEYIGRLDHQVKVRGYRIELGEIEEALMQCDGIKQAVAQVYENKPGDMRIAAYYQGRISRKELNRSLKDSLPSYMIPSVYIKVEQFPLTPNGKIDRKALPEPKVSDTEFEYRSPRNSYEKRLAAIFEAFLGVDRVSIDANFFSLGGHSLLAAQVITEVNKAFCIDLPLRTLFEHPSVEKIALEVEKSLKVSAYPLSISRGPKQDSFDLSPSQRRLWFLEQLHPNTSLYTIPITMELTGTLDRSCLQKALQNILQRHEVLRAVIKEEENGVKQVVLEPHQTSIKYLDLREEKNSKLFAKRQIAKESKRPFDLSKGPLYRFILLRLSKDEHLLFMNFHHIIFDGFSANLFLEELKLLYEAFLNGKTPNLPDASLQYGDYLHWQKNHLVRKKEKEDLLWWEKKLEGIEEPLNLPVDRPRPEKFSHKGAILDFQIGKKDLSNLMELAKANKTTLFGVVLTVFHLFLSRYSSQKEVVIGVPISGRNHESLSTMLGCFIETLALRTTSKSNDTFKELLKRISKEVNEAYQHPDIPFDKLVEKVGVSRTLSHSPIFQVMLNMLPPFTVEEIGEMQVKLHQEDRGQTHFDLSLSLQETPEGLSGIFEYSTDLFDRNTIKRMAKHFVNLLKEVIKQPKEKVCHYSFLSRKEQRQQLIEWNESSVKYEKNKTIIELIEMWAKKRPDGLAVVCGEETYSYSELNQEANKIAHMLLSKGIKTEDKVVICLDRSKEFIATVLGVLKAGGVYVPIDPAEPKDRTLAILRNLDPFCILTHERIRRSFSGQRVININQETLSSTSNPQIKISPDHLAYVIHTSGSTGKPKGVEIDHKSINDRVMWKQGAYPQAPEDVMLHTYSFIFDGAIINYFWPLCAGSTLVIASGVEQYDSDALVHIIQKRRVTTVDMLPTLLLGMIDSKGFDHCTSLKNVFSGGEALSSEVVRQFYHKCKTAKLHNTYGPTEATVEASAWECDPKDTSSIAPIGKPIAGAKLYILDGDLNVVPVGVPGELFIGGIGVARGYANAPALTREKFIQDPFSKDTTARLYRTGDLVKYRVDGTIEFLGRIDNQIKIRGYRVELGEIESILIHMDPVEKAAVVAHGQGAHKQLVAYVQLNPQMSNASFKLLMEHYLAEHLPSYMIPTQVAVLKKIPTLLNGKVNYKALPEVKFQAKTSSMMQEPNCKTEVHLVNIWREILNQADLSTTDNFFDVGGNSLLGMQMMAKVNREMNASIPLVSLFQHPTIQALASLIKKPSSKENWKSAVQMSSGGNKTPFFCVHPVGGSVLCYKGLADCWAEDRPFYALQAQGLEKGQRPLRSIPSMAHEYIKSIKEIQPEGPYLIGGWSFGGLVATEIVNQLQQEGDEVDLLVLLDTSAKIDRFKKIDVADEDLLFSELTHRYNVDPKKVETKLSPKERLLQLIEWGTKKSRKTGQDSIKRAIGLAKANYKSLQKFSIPKITATPVVVVRAKKNPEKLHDLGWSKYTDHVEVYEVEGDHWGLVNKEIAPIYAQLIEGAIDLLVEEKVFVKSHA